MEQITHKSKHFRIGRSLFSLLSSAELPRLEHSKLKKPLSSHRLTIERSPKTCRLITTRSPNADPIVQLSRVTLSRHASMSRRHRSVSLGEQKVFYCLLLLLQPAPSLPLLPPHITLALCPFQKSQPSHRTYLIRPILRIDGWS